MPVGCTGLRGFKELQRLRPERPDDQGSYQHSKQHGGRRRKGFKAEFIRFLHIAKGSAAELRTQVYIARQIGVIDGETQKELVEELKKISAMLHALIRSIRDSSPSA